MKPWFAKFRISAALDAGKPLPRSLRRAIAADPELEHFTRRAEALGRALRHPIPSEPAMRDSIMRAVRASARSRSSRRASWVGWLTVPACAAAAAAAFLWMGGHRPARESGPTLDEAAMVLEMSEKMPATMPALVMAPLSEEWARVDHDVQNTTQVLLASFP